MASTVLVRDALWRVCVLLGDTRPQFARFDERTLVQFFNDAALAIHRFLPQSTARIDAVRLTGGTQQSIDLIPQAGHLPGDGSAPAGDQQGTCIFRPVRNMGANGTTPGRAVTVVDMDTLDALDPDWHTSTDTVVREVCFDANNPRVFWTYPGVDPAASVWLALSYSVKPRVIASGGAPGAEVYAFSGTDQTKIPLHDEFLDDLVNYTVARASLADTKHADPIKATTHTTLFVQSLNAKVQAATGSNPNLTMLPGSTK